MIHHRTTYPSRFFGQRRTLRRCARTFAVGACAVLLMGATPGTAWAVSTRDLIELSKAGLGDEVLVALIEADGTVFNLDAPRILELRAEGVSERVITAMLKNAARPLPASPRAPADGQATAAPPAPDERDGAPYFVIIGDKPAPAPTPPAPTYIVPWVPWTGAHVRPARSARPLIEYRGFGRFINDGWVDYTRRRPH
jgi:hypothetical protein